MPRRRRHASGLHIDTDLVQAGLDAGFALLHLAETQFAAGARDDAVRALAEAERAWAEGQRRFQQLDPLDAPPYRPRLRELGGAIAAMKSAFGIE